MLKKVNVIDYSEKSSLLSSIIFFILGCVLFTNPGGIVEFIAYILGGVLIIVGIIDYLSYRKTYKNLNIANNSLLVTSIVLVILGIISIVCSGVIETVVRLIIGSWVLYSGIMRLIYTLNSKENSFTSRLIVSILLIICGLYIILKTNLVFKFIGLALIFYSILEIIGFISYTKKIEVLGLLFFKIIYLHIFSNLFHFFNCFISCSFCSFF